MLKESGSWILECGNVTPYWKAEVLPKSVNIYRPDYEIGLPIIHKHQEHGKWNNLATETLVIAEHGNNRASLKMRYSPKCYSPLAKRNVSFRVKGELNGEEVDGCCRSYQVH